MAVHDGFAIGVDLGTSNTVAVLRWPDGRTRPLLFDGAPVMPSAVYLDAAGTPHVGRDALRMAALDPARLEPNPKRRIDEPSVLLGAVEVPTIEVLAALLRAVAAVAVETVGFLPPAALTYPAAWGPRRREVLAGAATRAGWPPVRLVPEPVAAARYFTDVLRRPVPVGQALAVFDFGGGTLDIAVVRNVGTGFAVLGDGGIRDLGGLDVDAALVRHLGELLEHTEPLAWRPLASPDSTTMLRSRRQFWDDVRGAKEMLSRAPVAPVAVPGVEDAVHLTREELERIAGPLVHRAVQETGAVIARCGLRPDQLAGLFLVGGSSRLPLVARQLHAQLGIAPTVLEQPELPVAEGALAELPVTAGMVALPVPVAAASMPASRVTGPHAPAQAPISGPAGFPAPPVSGPPGFPAQPVSGPPGLLTAPISGPPGSLTAPVSGPPGLSTQAVSAPPGLVSPPVGGRSWYRRPAFWLAGGALAMVLVVAAALVLWFTRDQHPEVSFANNVVEKDSVPMGSDPDASIDGAYTVVGGGRAYLAYTDGTGLHLTVYDLASKAKRSGGVSISPDTSISWSGIWYTKSVLLAYGQDSSADLPGLLYGLDPTTGAQLWELAMDSSDRVFPIGDSVIHLDQTKNRLSRLDPVTGSDTWGKDDVQGNLGSSGDRVLPMLTDVDLAGAADSTGIPMAGFAEPAVVWIGSDGSARVIDTGSGNVKVTVGNVTDGSDIYAVYRDQLYSGKTAGGYQVTAFDLTGTGKTSTAYHTPDANRRLQSITPCGDRLCLVDQGDDGASSSQLLVVDPGTGTVRWHKDIPNAAAVLALGDAVLVNTDKGSVVYGSDGSVRYGALDNGQTGVRINAKSALFFGQPVATYLNDQGLTGLGVRSGQDKALGTLRQVRAASCSWTEREIICGADRAFKIWSFAT